MNNHPCPSVQISELAVFGALTSSGQDLPISAGFASSPFGRCLVAQTPAGICRLSFPEAGEEEGEWTALRQAWPQAQLRQDDAAAARTATAVFSAAHQGANRQTIRLFAQGTPFQVMVWQALLRIPCGNTLSYGQLAAAIGRPTAVRAVAGAVARNPIAFLIPCHRVLPASGGLGGYRWGQARKGAMLAWERARPAQSGIPA
ncbi:MAG: methylated-DNA--[protein]-cysteine S-methyltransferase [Desulfurivibrionaceae bacterium]